MAEIEIITKIRDFLNMHTPVSEECHVVYMLVEIRKILDYKNCTQFEILRFYCDWIVHIQKGHYLPIKDILDRIYNEGFDENNKMINGPKKETVTFISHSHLKEEIEQFLKELTLPLELISQENWNIFIGFLNSVLINQPIVILPAYKNIKEIKLVKVNEYIAAVTVSFD